MRMSYKYFLLGSVVATLTWLFIIFLYFHVLDSQLSPDQYFMEMDKAARFKFKPRQQMNPRANNPDLKYSYNELNNIISPMELAEKPVNLAKLAIIKKPEDQETRDRGE